MADSRDDRNLIFATSGGLSKQTGDVPDEIRRRYYFDNRGGRGLGFYTDATVRQPAFRDRGDRLTATRTDPHAIRQMMTIAQHRTWGVVVLRGEKRFRREAWLAASLRDIGVRGYKPTERDLQELERRRPAHLLPLPPTTDRDERSGLHTTRRGDHAPSQPGPHSRLKVVEAVVNSRITDPAARARLLEQARARIAGWLERGGRFDEVDLQRRPTVQRERGRGG
jgi:hypothetical protein